MEQRREKQLGHLFERIDVLHESRPANRIGFIRGSIRSKESRKFFDSSMRRWRFDWLEILLSYRVFFLIVSYFVIYACCAIRMKEFYGIIFVYLRILYFIGYFIGYFLSMIIYYT